METTSSLPTPTARRPTPLKNVQHWRDDNPTVFTAEQRATTTVLTTGFPESSIHFFGKALAPFGVKIAPLKTPGNSAYERGKEFGNRGQCNPTYFTVGALVERLQQLRDEEGKSPKEIVEQYAFVTAGGCGPCRMGMYATEYRKALRDSGFAGFRVMLLSRSGEATALSSGMKLPRAAFVNGFTGIIVGDILNVLRQRLSTYEAHEGDAERAVRACRDLIENALAHRRSVLWAAWKCRAILRAVPVNRLQVRPRILIQGEFWAKTTEGQGNYDLYRFLQKEGAEPVIETISDWLVHQIWRAGWSLRRREDLARHDAKAGGLKGKSVWKTRLAYAFAEGLLRGIFNLYARVIGLKDYKITDNKALADLAGKHMDLHLDGGEDHMEIGHHIQAVTERKANMILSVKPFTCLSSNGVSDGIQPILAEIYPRSIFVSVETNADAPANFYSRIQMQLFKAKKAAAQEVEEALARTGQTMEEVQAELAARPFRHAATHRSPHVYACDAANLVLEVGRRRGRKLAAVPVASAAVEAPAGAALA